MRKLSVTLQIGSSNRPVGHICFRKGSGGFTQEESHVSIFTSYFRFIRAAPGAKRPLGRLSGHSNDQVVHSAHISRGPGLQ